MTTSGIFQTTSNTASTSGLLHRSAWCRLNVAWAFFLVYLAISLVTRTVLMALSWSSLDASWLDVPVIFLRGLLFDLGFYSYFLIPFLLYVWLIPDRFWRSRINQALVHIFYFLSIYGFLFVAVAEYFFWDEFTVRFNFISVDYLVYTHEVTSNIQQSYPVGPILAGLGVLAAIIYWLTRDYLRRALRCQSRIRHRSGPVFLLLLLPLISYLGLNQQWREYSKNTFRNELASNGPYQFFAAFRNNVLDYDKFYPVEDDIKVTRNLFRLVHKPLPAQPEAIKPYDIGRFIDNPGAEQRHNVILVTIESFNADFLKRFADQRGYPDTVKPALIKQYGGSEGMTPFLDALIDQSLFFSRMYATGTRTVRGLEAITLSIPPTPGRSIVKRLGHESGMHSLGQVFRDKGYDVRFIYGGRGYFDNMNAFFAGNGYGIIDQDNAEDFHHAIAFENAWGMSDGDLYDITLQQADRSHQQGKPFFFQLMTTSNHRPFTFPEGAIDWPQHNRESVIAYTSHAIGEFLRKAKSKPWFDDTIFVFIADHTSRAAGKASLQVRRYHIPMWIYAPRLIKPKTIDTLSSQIDVAPTILALLNMDYESWFFGLDINTMQPEEERALIGNYQKLGLFKKGILTYLAPVKQVVQRDEETSQTVQDQQLLDDTIAYYQGADRVYRCGLNLLKPPANADQCLQGEIKKAR
jgi:phosphoglycerol transferase MdoB-like AlkP superfamily enzyme